MKRFKCWGSKSPVGKPGRVPEGGGNVFPALNKAELPASPLCGRLCGAVGAPWGRGGDGSEG